MACAGDELRDFQRAQKKPRPQGQAAYFQNAAAERTEMFRHPQTDSAVAACLRSRSSVEELNPLEQVRTGGTNLSRS